MTETNKSRHGANGTLVEMLLRRSVETPEKLAYAFLTDNGSGTEQISEGVTFRRLVTRACAIAANIQKVDGKGARVIVVFPPGLDVVAALFGCFFAGVVAVPIKLSRANKALDQIKMIADDAQSTLVLTTRKTLSSITPYLDDFKDTAPSLRWLAVDAVADTDADYWRDLMVEEADLAYLQYTSGSTSAPKGVMISHHNACANLDDTARSFGVTQNSTLLFWLPYYHDFGLVYGILTSAYVGATCYLMSPSGFVQTPIRWLSAISQFRATHTGAPNFAFVQCLLKTDKESRGKLDLSCVRAIVNGAEPINVEVFESFCVTFAEYGLMRRAMCPGYGLAESTMKVTGIHMQEEPRALTVLAGPLRKGMVVEAVDDCTTNACVRLMSCGAPEQGIHVSIVDPATREACKEQEVGEIWVRGSSVASGYWNKSRESRETFGGFIAGSGAGPFLRTGDLGFISNGHLFVTGRLKDVIIIKGENHYPQDIEQAAQGCHAALQVGACAAFSVNNGGEELVIVVQEVRRDSRNVDSTEVAQLVRQSIAKNTGILVRSVLLVRTGVVPKTTSGKIQRRACRDMFLDGRLSGRVVDYAAAEAS